MLRWNLSGSAKKWAETTRHDVSILPGGFVLHHRGCWCHNDAIGDLFRRLHK